MAMVIELPDLLAERVTARAAERGVSPTDVVFEFVTVGLGDDTTDDDGIDVFEAFFGCGASGDTKPSTIHEMRHDLAARKSAAGIENL